MSSLTDVQICNMALARIGARVRLTATPTSSDATEEGRVCSIFYANCLSRALRDFDWGEVSKCAALAGQIDADDVDGAGTDAPWKYLWLFAYTYPTDALCIRQFVTPNGRYPVANQPFEVGIHVASGTPSVKVFCNLDEDEAIVRYTMVPTAATPTLLTDEQGSLIAWLLAYELGMPLAVDMALRRDCFQHYRQALAEARAASGTEQQRPDDPNGEIIRARG